MGENGWETGERDKGRGEREGTETWRGEGRGEGVGEGGQIEGGGRRGEWVGEGVESEVMESVWEREGGRGGGER